MTIICFCSNRGFAAVNVKKKKLYPVEKRENVETAYGRRCNLPSGDGEQQFITVMKYSNHNATFVCLCHGCTIVNLAENDIENRSQQENFPFISTLNRHFVV
ncbi:hypothetical protein T07_58 [Trichinella nelsoni]|uniref:Uncharacterized protein n=1 Tax=Trichinella nelsoni TaxID=6336 RepID=A0A0V0RV51_9BILA|nr:hypothetical protein T07_58 [Trichinella nelsoni]